MSGPKHIPPPPPQAPKQRRGPSPPLPAARGTKDELSGFFDVDSRRQVPPPLPRSPFASKGPLPPSIPSPPPLPETRPGEEDEDKTPPITKLPFGVQASAPAPKKAVLPKPIEPEPLAKPSSRSADGHLPKRPSDACAPGNIQPKRPPPRRLSPQAAAALRKNQSNEPVRFSSIDITDAVNALGNAATIIVERGLQHLKADAMFQEIANTCARLQPAFEFEEFRFGMEGITVRNENIGDFDGEPGRIKVSVPLEKLGHSLKMLPLAAIEREFDTSPKAMGGVSLTKAIASAHSVELVAMEIGSFKAIKLCFYNSEERQIAAAPQKYASV